MDVPGSIKRPENGVPDEKDSKKDHEPPLSALLLFGDRGQPTAVERGGRGDDGCCGHCARNEQRHVVAVIIHG